MSRYDTHGTAGHGGPGPEREAEDRPETGGEPGMPGGNPDWGPGRAVPPEPSDATMREDIEDDLLKGRPNGTGGTGIGGGEDDIGGGGGSTGGAMSGGRTGGSPGD